MTDREREKEAKEEREMSRQDMLRKKPSSSELNRRESDQMLPSYRKGDSEQAMLRKPSQVGGPGLAGSKENTERDSTDGPFVGLKKALKPSQDVTESTNGNQGSLTGSSNAGSKPLPNVNKATPEQLAISNMKRTIELLIDKVESLERNLETQVRARSFYCFLIFCLLLCPSGSLPPNLSVLSLFFRLTDF